jgi:hypothetical protein
VGRWIVRLLNLAIGDRTVLSTATEDLPKFAAEQANDIAAFSEGFAFHRKK